MTPDAIFFDVDFTLIYPGPTFDAEGYTRFAARHGMTADPSRFEGAVAAASIELDHAQDAIYRPEPFVRYAARVITDMGGSGAGLERCAREIYDEWAACQHFALYDDVAPVLRELHTDGFRIGLISNTHRCLTSFQSHFELDGLVTVALSSSDHGYLKPHPSIFVAALTLMDVAADRSVMVGDSLTHDIVGARQVGMHGVLLARSGTVEEPVPDDVPVIGGLSELSAVLKDLATATGS